MCKRRAGEDNAQFFLDLLGIFERAVMAIILQPTRMGADLWANQRVYRLFCQKKKPIEQRGGLLVVGRADTLFSRSFIIYENDDESGEN